MEVDIIEMMPLSLLYEVDLINPLLFVNVHVGILWASSIIVRYLMSFPEVKAVKTSENWM